MVTVGKTAHRAVRFYFPYHRKQHTWGVIISQLFAVFFIFLLDRKSKQR